MKKLINLFLILLITVASVNGQNKADPIKKKDLKKIELRPNSRDYGPVRLDNQHKRIEIKRDKAVIQKKKAAIQRKKAIIQKNKAQIRREKIIKRRQTTIQQRRNLRK